MTELQKRPSYAFLNICLSLSVYIGPKKPQWGPANYVYLHFYIKEGVNFWRRKILTILYS